MSDRTRFEELAHQVNNLIATVEIQSEVARTVATEQAYAEALRLITASAKATHACVEELRGRPE